MSDTGNRPLFQRIAVIGVGLIGGSLARACRGKVAREVIGLDKDRTHLKRAVDLGLVDRAADLPRGVGGAELVIIAVPVGSFPEVAPLIAPFLSPGSIVTDVGSVKGALVEEVETRMPSGTAYVPGHPIAGTERSGPEAASADLFRGSLCVLTPTPRTPEEAVKRVTRLWEEMGARVLLMDPFRHDRIFAVVSHLPHVVAYALMGTILDLQDGDEELFGFSAGGLRDFTRIAASHPIMWRDILLSNREEVLAALARFRKVLTRIEEMIRGEDPVGLVEEFQRAREVREKLR